MFPAWRTSDLRWRGCFDEPAGKLAGLQWRARGVNLLVLDEPTNHLDLPAIEKLESALDAYAGTLLLVTHDRRMLQAVRTNRRIDVQAGHVTTS